MAIPKHDKHKDYVRYAEHCLKRVPVTPDQEYRVVQREMAAEWLKLADAALAPTADACAVYVTPSPNTAHEER